MRRGEESAGLFNIYFLKSHLSILKFRMMWCHGMYSKIQNCQNILTMATSPCTTYSVAQGIPMEADERVLIVHESWQCSHGNLKKLSIPPSHEKNACRNMCRICLSSNPITGQKILDCVRLATVVMWEGLFAPWLSPTSAEWKHLCLLCTISFLVGWKSQTSPVDW